VTLRSEIDRISNVTKFNNTNLLSGGASTVNFQVGIGTSQTDDQIGIVFGGINVSSLGLSGQNIASTASALQAITAVDGAIGNLATLREGFGAGMNRLQYAVSNIEATVVNLSAAHSRIKDVDVAEETSKLSRQQVLSQAGAAMLAQANQSPQLALTLLRG
jgi:flagellin